MTTVNRVAFTLEDYYQDPFPLSSVEDSESRSSIRSDWLLHSHRILANQHLFPTHSSVAGALLNLGCSVLGARFGLCLEPISSDVFCARADCGRSAEFFEGQHIPLAELPVLAHQRSGSLMLAHEIWPEGRKCGNLARLLSPMVTCLGLSVTRKDQSDLHICFFFDKHVDEAQVQGDSTVFLELLAEGIAGMMESQKLQGQRKQGDRVARSSGSIKTLEEYQEAAKLPEIVGVVGKVVQTLSRRIGQSSLGIENVASDLNLSKRTLQRRLQNQGVSFAELRDTVRFHHSIDFLVRQQTSIDRISSTLDFSDRTSFTNAFKRWTGLSPSTFRKVFRDYV